VTARLSRWRTAPLLALLAMLAFGLAGSAVARAGFAWLQPTSFIGEEIARDPTSPIAISHEIARKNGVAPGPNLRGLVVALLAALALVGAAARRRPLAASVAFGLVLVAGVGLALARQPAFAQALPSAAETSVAVLVTTL